MRCALLLALLAQPAAPPPTVHVYEFTAPVAVEWTSHVAVPRSVRVSRAEVRLTATSEIALIAESVAAHTIPPRSAVVAVNRATVTAGDASVQSTARTVGRIRTLGDGLTDFRGPSGTRELGRRTRSVAAPLDPARFEGRGKESVALAGSQAVQTTAKGNPNTLRGWIARTRVRVEVTLWP